VCVGRCAPPRRAGQLTALSETKLRLLKINKITPKTDKINIRPLLSTTLSYASNLESEATWAVHCFGWLHVCTTVQMTIDVSHRQTGLRLSGNGRIAILSMDAHQKRWPCRLRKIIRYRRVIVRLKYLLHPSLRHSISSMLFSFHRFDAISTSIARTRSISLRVTKSSSLFTEPVAI
jgi:hypothetical protein